MLTATSLLGFGWKFYNLILIIVSSVLSYKSLPQTMRFLWQMEKTKVIKRSLNPVWNEELTFSIKEPVTDLKLVRS